MSATKKSNKRSFAWKQSIREGAALANQLPIRMGLKDTAKAMGLSQTMVRRIECQALAKVAHRLKELLAQEELVLKA